MEVKAYSINLSEQMAVCDANYIRILKLLTDTPLQTKGQANERNKATANSFDDQPNKQPLKTRSQKKLLPRKEIMLPSPGIRTLGSAQTLVVIEVIESFKYTSTIKISQKQDAQSVQYDTPEMLIRMYHDASTAEVISYQGHKYFKARYPLPNKKMYHADEKEQLNLFLGQWLQLCQMEGLYPGEKLSEEYRACFECE